MGKPQGIAPGQRLPKGAFYDKYGNLHYPPNPPIAKVIVMRLPRDKR